MTSGTSYSPPPAFGRFRLLHQVGAGVLGPVFRTHDADADRLVAVKAFTLDLTPEQAEAFAEELRRLTLVDLASARLAAPIDAGVEESVAYLAQQYVAGESLDAALRQYGPAPTADAARLIGHVADALDAGARVHVFHGALHPRDILVTPGETHLTGYGVATALEHVGMRPPIRRPYVAPERESGGLWGAAADIFSLAAIAHEVLTGRRASPGTAEPLPGLDDLKLHDRAALIDLLETALDPDPERRPATAADFAAAFAAALGLAAGAGATSTPAGRRRRPRAKAIPKLPGLDEPLVEPDAAPPPEALPPPIIVRPPDVVHVSEPEDLSGMGESEPPAGAAEEVHDDVVFDTREAEFDLPDSMGPREGEPPDLGFGDIRFTLTPEPADILRQDVSPDLMALSEELERLDAPRSESPSGPVQLPDEFAAEPPGGPFVEQPARLAERRHASTRGGPPSVDEMRDPGSLLSEPPVPRAFDPATPSRPASPSRRVEPYRPLPPPEKSVAFPVGLGVIGGLAAGLLIGYWLGARVPDVTPAQAGAPPATVASSTPPVATPPGPPAGTVPPAGLPPAQPASGGAAAAAQPPPSAAVTSGVRTAPPVAAVQSGGIRVRTTPDKAEVYVDGERQGVTPRNVTGLPLGTYTVRVTRQGYVAQEREVTIGPDALNPRASFVLARTPRRPAAGRAPQAAPQQAGTPASGATRPARGIGTLSIETRPPGARVRLDNKDVGVSPIVLGDVAAGTHTVRLDLSGYKTWATTVTVKPGERLRVSASLERSTTR